MGSNHIHPSAVIGRGVVLGQDNYVGPHVVIAGRTVIGDGNWFGAGVVVGALPEVRGWPHDATWLDEDPGDGVLIGHRNVLRDGVQVHRGWKGRTVVGDDAFLMNQVYIAHDCELGHGVTMASHVAVGGHCRIGDGANLGLGTVVHQRTTIGGVAMVGMGSVVNRDLPPFVKAYGNPCRVRGINMVGMERKGFSAEQVAAVVDAHARDALAELIAATPEFALLAGPGH